MADGMDEPALIIAAAPVPDRLHATEEGLEGVLTTAPAHVH